jgi:hypothetical protein
VTRRVRMTWDVIFDKGCSWDWSKETNGSAMASSSMFTVDYTEFEGFGGAGDSPSASGSPAPAPMTPSPTLDSTPPVAPTTSLKHGGSCTPVFAPPLEGDEDRIDVAYDNTLLRYRTIGTLKTGYPRIQALSQGKEQGVYTRAATQAVAPGLAFLLRWPPGPPCALRLQLPLPSPGQLRGRHVPCGSSSRCPARGSSGAATCPAAPSPAARPGAGPGPSRVP